MKKPIIVGILFVILLGLFLLSAGCSDSSIETTPTSIAMATDKMQYVRGEIVKLKVTNSLDVPIWYIGYPQRDLVFWEIERSQNNSWQRLDFRLPIIEEDREVCQIIMYERPIGTVTELKPHSELLYEWNQKICQFKTVTEPFESEKMRLGNSKLFMMDSKG